MLRPGPLADPPISVQPSEGEAGGGAGGGVGDAMGGGGALVSAAFRGQMPKTSAATATAAAAPSPTAFQLLPARSWAISTCASAAEAGRDSGNFSRSRSTTRSMRGSTSTTLEGGLK